jgi:hypothetical protein
MTLLSWGDIPGKGQKSVLVCIWSKANMAQDTVVGCLITYDEVIPH